MGGGGDIGVGGVGGLVLGLTAQGENQTETKEEEGKDGKTDRDMQINLRTRRHA